MLTNELLEEYSRHKLHSRSTASLVRGAVRHWHRLQLHELSAAALESYRDTRLSEGAASATVRGELSKLLALSKWLHPEGVAPVIVLPNSPARCPNSWTKQQVKRLLYEARTTKRTIWGMQGNVYWPALLGVALDTGERIGALLGVRWPDISLQNKLITFNAEIRKGGYSDSTAMLSRQSCSCLCRMLRSMEQMRSTDIRKRNVFLHGSPSTLWKAYGRLLADAGLPNDRRSKFHRLRRTTATRAYLAGEDATALLGHSSDAVTRKSYIDWQVVRQAKRSWWQRVFS